MEKKITFEQWSLGVAAASCAVSMISVVIGTMQLSDQANTIRAQTSVALVDEATKLGADLIKDKSLTKALVENVVDPALRRGLADKLEPYQLLIFKASVYYDKGLVDLDFHRIFVSDFCKLMKYDYFNSWWQDKKILEPYKSLSSTYRSFDEVCQRVGGKR